MELTGRVKAEVTVGGVVSLLVLAAAASPGCHPTEAVGLGVVGLGEVAPLVVPVAVAAPVAVAWGGVWRTAPLVVRTPPAVTCSVPLRPPTRRASGLLVASLSILWTPFTPCWWWTPSTSASAECVGVWCR